MAKMELPDPTGKCPTCGVNLYPPNDEPVKMPCNVGLFRSENRDPKDRLTCPFETKEQQTKSMIVLEADKVAGLLNSQHGDG